MAEREQESEAMELCREFAKLAKDLGVARPSLDTFLLGLPRISSLLDEKSDELEGPSKQLAKFLDASIDRITTIAPNGLTASRDKIEKFRYVVRVNFNLPVSTVDGKSVEVAPLSEVLTARRTWIENEAPSKFRVSIRTSSLYLEHAIAEIVRMSFDKSDKAFPSADKSRRPSPLAAGTLLLVVVVVAVLIALLVTRTADVPQTEAIQTDSPPSIAASSAQLDVQIVSAMESNSAEPIYALPEPLAMTDAEMTAFNNEIFVNSAPFQKWREDHKATTAVETGIVSIMVTNKNAYEVTLADMTVDKQCAEPYNGTYFAGHVEGGGHNPNMMLSFDLDRPKPMAEQLSSISPGRIAFTGTNFFKNETKSLASGESKTLAIAAYTKNYSCSFSFNLIFKTPDGLAVQHIDDGGKPFVVTAMAKPVKPNADYSGYRAAYQQEENLRWRPVDPFAEVKKR